MATIPTDDMFSQQWFLNNTVTGQFDLDVIDVWDDYTGKGVVVAVMDSGVDHAHTDIAPNYDTTRDYDFGQRDEDAAPTVDTRDEAHGTAVAGIIGAAANNGGVVGVAYGSTLVGYRVEYGTDSTTWSANYSDGLHDAADNNIDIVNMSFGFYEFYGTYFSVEERQTQVDAVAYAVETGRAGLGTILVKSAGNSRADDIDLNYAEVGNDTTQIIVAAVDRTGFVTTYSTYGAAMLVSAFGSPLNGTIVTTDRTGTPGYNTSNYMTAFNGTSAAAPMVSGLVSLMLEANPDLGWRDVQTILATSARHVGSDVGAAVVAGSERYLWGFNTATNWNGGGMHFSEDYGYGLVDAKAAVRLAEAWQAAPATSANEKSLTLDLFDGSDIIPDNTLAGKSYSATAGGSLLVERVTVALTFETTRTSDLAFYLTGPDGVEHLLSADAGTGETLSYDDTFTFQSQAYRGISSKGEWSVRAVDDATGQAITITDIKISLYGTTDIKNDTYYYSDEFSDFLDTHSTSLKDTDGGTDTLNAVMVTSVVSVNLDKGKGTIDGTAIKLSGIENVYAGDGDDVIIGSKGNNDLAGGRGADTLTGGKGKDDFFYFTLKDSRSEESHDLLKDFAKGDRIDLHQIDAILDDLDINDAFSFIKGAAFDFVKGQLRFELVDLKGKNHDATYIEADVTGDSVADFMIELSGLHKLKGSDFAL